MRKNYFKNVLRKAISSLSAMTSSGGRGEGGGKQNKKILFDGLVPAIIASTVLQVPGPVWKEELDEPRTTAVIVPSD